MQATKLNIYAQNSRELWGIFHNWMNKYAITNEYTKKYTWWDGKRRRRNHASALLVWGLFLGDRTHGAGISASTALDASGSVDLILSVALRDSAHGATTLARTTHHAIGANLVSHKLEHLHSQTTYILSIFYKKINGNLKKGINFPNLSIIGERRGKYLRPKPENCNFREEKVGRTEYGRK
jgi:hypothetical protein